MNGTATRLAGDCEHVETVKRSHVVRPSDGACSGVCSPSRQRIWRHTALESGSSRPPCHSRCAAPTPRQTYVCIKPRNLACLKRWPILVFLRIPECKLD